jgi:hypothetical protein
MADRQVANQWIANGGEKMNVKMSRKWLVSLSVTLGMLILLWAIGSAMAQGPEPQGDISAAATVNSRISYQGVLTEGGTPVTGNRNMVFSFYTNNTCSAVAVLQVTKNNVPVTDGLFSVELDVTHAVFWGQGLWLEVEVGGTSIGCKEILPVPYALSLRPGAEIKGEPTAWDGWVLRVNMDGTWPSGKAVLGSTATGSAVYGESAGGYGVNGYSDNGYAVRGVDAGTETARGYGGYFTSDNGVGVYGYSGADRTVSNNYAPGVYGRSANGVGVYGVSESSAPSAGVYGQASTGSAVRGESSDGYGVYGYSDNTYAVQGQSVNSVGGYFTSNEGYGIRVNTDGNNHWDHAGYFTADWGYGIYALSDENMAIRGEAGDISGMWQPGGQVGVVGIGEDRGVYGSSRDREGVYGVSVNGEGVYGSSEHSHGVYGWAQGSATDQGYGGYFYSSNYRGLYASSASSYYAGYFVNRGGSGWPGLYVDGTLYTTGAKTGYVVDICFNEGPGLLETGDVVVVTGFSEPVVGEIPVIRVHKATEAESTGVVGVVDQSFTLEASPDDEGRSVPKPVGGAAHIASGTAISPGKYLSVVTLGSFKAIKVDASYGDIQPGDLLVSSPNPGYAMRVEDPRVGTIIGKALGALVEGTGVIPVLITLH